MQLKSLLEKMIEVHASDVFIIAGLPLAYQVSGSHVRTDTAPLTPADTQEYIETIYELAGRDLSLFTDSVNHDDDFSFAVPSVGRFRANIFRQRGSYGAVIRVIPFGLPDPDEMNIPESVMRLAEGIQLVGLRQRVGLPLRHGLGCVRGGDAQHGQHRQQQHGHQRQQRDGADAHPFPGSPCHAISPCFRIATRRARTLRRNRRSR